MGRKSKITKSIERTYNVAKFESLKIVINYEEEIEWDTTKDRQLKSNNISKLLLKDFKDTRQSVFKELKESEKKAYFENALDSMGEVTEDDIIKDLAN